MKGAYKLLSIISGLVWCVLSAAVMIAGAKISNQRASEILKENEGLQAVYHPYEKNRKFFIMLVVFAVLSFVCGYAAAKSANSEIVDIQLCFSYLAVLFAAVIDHKLHIIPNFISLSLLGIRAVILLYEWIVGMFVFENLISSITGCILCWLILTAADKLSSGGIGKGDIKLLSAIGFSCGAYTVFSVLLLALTCCSVTAFFLVLRKKAVWKDHLPFGPFIYAGFFCMLIISYL